MVALKFVRPGEKCVINGHVCQVTRQARKSTFVRIVESEDHDIIGQTVQLPRMQVAREV